MKDDAPVPDRVPTKRRQLHDALDRWLAVWATREDLTKRERALVEDERSRRKSLKPSLVVGLLVPGEGVTPPQLESLRDRLAESGATEVQHVSVPSRVHTACRDLGVPVHVRDTDRDVVRDSDVVIATPKERAEAASPLWDTVRYARHRKLPVKLVMPDGSLR